MVRWLSGGGYGVRRVIASMLSALAVAACWGPGSGTADLVPHVDAEVAIDVIPAEFDLPLDGDGSLRTDLVPDQAVATDGLATPECYAAGHMCSAAGCGVDGLPSCWGPSAVVVKVWTPDSQSSAAELCPDWDGDGAGDSGLVNVASALNTWLAGASATSGKAVVLNLRGTSKDVGAPPFVLDWLLAQAACQGGLDTVDVAKRSFDALSCAAQFRFSNVGVDGGLDAGPQSFGHLVSLVELGMSAEVGGFQVRLKGDVTFDALGRMAVTNAVLSGVAPSAYIDGTLKQIDERCSGLTGPVPDYCMLASIRPGLRYPLVQVGIDHETATFRAPEPGVVGDTIPFCFVLSAEPTSIRGYIKIEGPAPAPGMCNDCTPWITSSPAGMCHPNFDCFDPGIGNSGCWSVEASCCWCITCDCGKPCFKKGDCTGPCFLDDDQTTGPGYCSENPGECDGVRVDGCRDGCQHYLDTDGQRQWICVD